MRGQAVQRGRGRGEGAPARGELFVPANAETLTPSRPFDLAKPNNRILLLQYWCLHQCFCTSRKANLDK